MAVILLLSGPIRWWLLEPGGFSNHPLNIPTGQRVHRLPTTPVSSFYRRLAREDESYSIIESPWYPHWLGNPFFRLQNLHRKGVFIGFVQSETGQDTIYSFPVRHAGLRFSRFVDLHDCAAIASTGARYLVLHRDLQEEIGVAATGGWKTADVSRLASHLRARRINPVFEDRRLVVFEVRRVVEHCDTASRATPGFAREAEPGG